MSDPAAHARIRPRRSIRGMSAVLLPFEPDGTIDWRGFADHLDRTRVAGLVPAVNMDTGFGSLLGPADRLRALEITTRGGADFVAAAYVDDEPGAPFDLDGYRHTFDEIVGSGGMPIVFPSYGMHELPEHELVPHFAALGRDCDRMLAFELGEMFSPMGRIFALDTYRDLLDVPACVGAKHSSLSREAEWARLALRDAERPDFLVLTGNDLAIDMVMYGSDYLLGVSTFAPDAFALRDRYWADGDDRFYELNDLLQYLGAFAFRPPVPGYRHDAAMFLRRRGWIASEQTHPASPTRPASDGPVLDDMRQRLDALLAG